jgi:hypothetical protein
VCFRLSCLQQETCNFSVLCPSVHSVFFSGCLKIFSLLLILRDWVMTSIIGVPFKCLMPVAHWDSWICRFVAFMDLDSFDHSSSRSRFLPLNFFSFGRSSHTWRWLHGVSSVLTIAVFSLALPSSSLTYSFVMLYLISIPSSVSIISLNICFYFFFLVELGFELKALHFQSRSSATWATPSVYISLVILEMRSCKLFALAGLELQSSDLSLPSS